MTSGCSREAMNSVTTGSPAPSRQRSRGGRRRKTDIPIDLPDALTLAFAEDPIKQKQWDAFVREVAVQRARLVEVVDDLAEFLMPPVERARKVAAKGGG
jgi:hypothetical protein